MAPTDQRRDRKIVWRFACDCGREVLVAGKDAVSGNTRSCGCLTGDSARELALASRADKQCPECSTVFSCKQSAALRTTYCGKACMALAYARRLRGSSNPNYKGVTLLMTAQRKRSERKSNPEKTAAHDRAARARRKGATGFHTADDIARLLIVQSNKCALCRDGLGGVYHVDHVIPLAKGGTNFVGNIQLLCPQCNLRKRTMLPIEYKVRVLAGKTEDAEQSRLFDWAAHHSDPRLALLYHVPNGGFRSKATASRLQLLGVKRGFPDIALPVMAGRYLGLYIEMKVGRNKPTEEQAAWLSALSSSHHKTLVAYSWEEARDAIVDYLDAAPCWRVEVA